MTLPQLAGIGNLPSKATRTRKTTSGTCCRLDEVWQRMRPKLFAGTARRPKPATVSHRTILDTCTRMASAFPVVRPRPGSGTALRLLKGISRPRDDLKGWISQCENDAEARG